MVVLNPEALRTFLKATAGLTWKVYQTMPADWTPATSVAPRLKQSTRSSALGILRRAGAVEAKRKGRIVLYRPKPSFSVRAVASRSSNASEVQHG